MKRLLYGLLLISLLGCGIKEKVQGRLDSLDCEKVEEVCGKAIKACEAVKEEKE